MMSGKKENELIIIEEGHIMSYLLDDKNIWEVGRPSKNNSPDIKLKSTTVSRKHGRFQNMEGIWFYVDYNGKNGTVYNKKHISVGINGRIKPVMIEDGDVFVFGGGEEEVINHKTVWGLFITRDFDKNWRVVDTKNYSMIQFTTSDNTIVLEQPQKGTVIDKRDGIAIYMGDLTYLNGQMEVIGL